MTTTRRWLAMAIGCCVASAAAAQKPADPNRALLVEVKGEVSAKGADGNLAPLAKGAELARGQELTTGVDSEAKLAFADGTEMVVGEMTQIMVSDLLAKGSRQAVTVQLKLGEVSAHVNPKKAFQTDFKVTTPSGTASVRGTEIKRLTYNPTTGMHVDLATGQLFLTNTRGVGTNMTGGDNAVVTQDNNVHSAHDVTLEDARLHTEPPVTSSELQTVNVANQPQGFTPSAADQSVTSEGSATFVFRFKKQ